MAEAMIPAEPRLTTYAEFQALPETNEHIELVYGVLRQMPAPTVTHQHVSGRLHLKLAPPVIEQKLGRLLYAPLDVRLADSLVYQPDLLFVARDGKAAITQTGVDGPPDLVIEIVSGSSSRIDRKEKFTNYAKHGVREYWLVFPDSWTIEVYVRRNDQFRLLSRYGEGDRVRSEVLAGLEFPAETIFEE